MTEVEVYLDKLEVLKEYMDYFIQITTYNMEYAGTEAMMRIYRETGYIVDATPCNLKTFDRFYAEKIIKKFHETPIQYEFSRPVY